MRQGHRDELGDLHQVQDHSTAGSGRGGRRWKFVTSAVCLSLEAENMEFFWNDLRFGEVDALFFEARHRILTMFQFLRFVYTSHVFYISYTRKVKDSTHNFFRGIFQSHSSDPFFVSISRWQKQLIKALYG